MNSLERYLGVLRGEAVDHLPRVPILMQYAAEYIGSNYGSFASDHKVLVEANLRCAEDFGFDQVSAISDPYRETQGFGGQVTYVRDGVPRCTAPMKDTTDLSVLQRPAPHKSERMLDRVNAIRAYKKRCGGRYSILGWIEGPAAEAADLREVSNFLMDVALNRDFACDLMDRCVDVGIEFARAQVEAGADTIGVGDAIASQMSPAIYEEMILPREQRLFRAIKEMGAFIKLHICGNITHLLPGIAQLDIDMIDVDHMVDIAAVRKAVGSRVAITGNIDPVSGVRRGMPGAIRKTMREIYEKVGNPYMVNAGCEIPSCAPAENLKALCEPIPYRR
ncbi:MAG: uroporphyrinogen decarboxylase family protein [Planctomycetota bacterium]